jgi:hypothetical protein
VASKQRSAAVALSSVRVEGLEPEPAVVELLERWGRGEVSDKEFAEAQRTLACRGTLKRARTRRRRRA